MEKVFDFLARSGLKDFQSIEKSVMYEWPLARVVDFSSKLVTAIEEYYVEKSPTPTDFTFLANADLSGHRAGCCVE